MDFQTDPVTHWRNVFSHWHFCLSLDQQFKAFCALVEVKPLPAELFHLIEKTHLGQLDFCVVKKRVVFMAYPNMCALSHKWPVNVSSLRIHCTTKSASYFFLKIISFSSLHLVFCPWHEECVYFLIETVMHVISFICSDCLRLVHKRNCCVPCNFLDWMLIYKLICIETHFQISMYWYISWLCWR